MFDTFYDQKGNLIFKDTPKNWELWTLGADVRIASEVHGERPEAGYQTWNDFWVSLIARNRKGQENPDKYTSYVVDRRRMSGLPELQGVSE
jgi:hypothetical protein